MTTSKWAEHWMLTMGEDSHTILYIDDNDQAGRLMRIYLQRAGFDVLVAKGAAEARMHLASVPVDAVITDIGLPGESGVEFYKWLNKEEKYRELPVLLVSAHAFGFEGFMAEHRDIFMTKPIFFPELINKLKEMIASTGGVE